MVPLFKRKLMLLGMGTPAAPMAPYLEADKEEHAGAVRTMQQRREEEGERQDKLFPRTPIGNSV